MEPSGASVHGIASDPTVSSSTTSSAAPAAVATKRCKLLQQSRDREGGGLPLSAVAALPDGRGSVVSPIASSLRRRRTRRDEVSNSRAPTQHAVAAGPPNIRAPSYSGVRPSDRLPASIRGGAPDGRRSLRGAALAVRLEQKPRRRLPRESSTQARMQ